MTGVSSATPSARSVFPCLTRATDLERLEEGSYLAWEFDDDLVSLLVTRDADLFRPVHPDEALALGLEGDALWELALGNLTTAIQDGELEFGVGELGPGQQIIIVQAHWLASSLASHGGVYALAAQHLDWADLRIALPSRDAAVIFRADLDAGQRGMIAQIVDELVAASEHPFGHKVFVFTASGAVAQDVASATAPEPVGGGREPAAELLTEIVEALAYLASELAELGDEAEASFAFVKSVVVDGRAALALVGMDDVAEDAVDRAIALFRARDLDGARVTLENVADQLNRAVGIGRAPDPC